ncbi:aldolase [Violaceomyces palustris]|uniref:Aldolase n=1 Tax=Violaceomyces palustris TaxID=1673888 RepID=A0ACD0NVS5_9BASI|nr:aldolase [Violaceomyces palustris]
MAPTASSISPAPIRPSSSSNPRPCQESKTLGRGIYVPVLTFFNQDESLDLVTFEQHVAYVASSGVAGIVVLGSTGEAVSLSEQERSTVSGTCRKAMDDAGQTSMPLISGAGGHSVLMAKSSLKAAHEAGASHALVLPSSYYPNQLGPVGALEFYRSIADDSPLPILIYSYPGVSSGINLSSEVIRTLSEHPNIRGVKHTDHDIGKMARNCALNRASSSTTATTDASEAFFVLGGASDYLTGALAVGAHGTITGMGNMAPRSVVEIQRLWDSAKYAEALKLQHVVSLAEWELGKGGVPIHKAIVDKARGYGGNPRSPLQPSSESTIQEAWKGFSQLIKLEKSLESVAF